MASTMRVSHAIARDFPDLRLAVRGPGVIAGLLYVPLFTGTGDFVAFLRKEQPREVRWAGRPCRPRDDVAEPRRTFKVWSQTVMGTCEAWNMEHVEVAAVLALAHGKVCLSRSDFLSRFIWRVCLRGSSSRTHARRHCRR